MGVRFSLQSTYNEKPLWRTRRGRAFRVGGGGVVMVCWVFLKNNSPCINKQWFWLVNNMPFLSPISPAEIRALI